MSDPVSLIRHGRSHSASPIRFYPRALYYYILLAGACLSNRKYHERITDFRQPRVSFFFFRDALALARKKKLFFSKLQ